MQILSSLRELPQNSFKLRIKNKVLSVLEDEDSFTEVHKIILFQLFRFIFYSLLLKEKHIFFQDKLLFSIILSKWPILVSNEQNPGRLMAFCNCG